MALPTGVEIVGNSIRIRFMWSGRRRCETLALPPTPQSIQRAADLRSTVVQLAKLGLLTDEKYAELFPNTRQKLYDKGCLFGEYAQLWLDSLQVAPSTRRTYKRVLNQHWMPLWATRPLKSIKPADCRIAMARQDEWVSVKSKNRAATVVRQLFNAAVRDAEIDLNPMRVIKAEREPAREIDPFTREERDAIIEWLYKEYTGPQVIYPALFEFAFHTGVRISEIFALRWDDLDESRGQLIVRGGLVDRNIINTTKTRKSRKIWLLPSALHALRVVEPWTRARSPFIFAPPFTAQHLANNGPHFTNTEMCRYVFKRALRKLGIRDRRQRDTRHTFASLALMDGAKVGFIAQQLGHSIKTLTQHYATWIRSDDDVRELERLKNGSFGTKVAQENTATPSDQL